MCMATMHTEKYLRHKENAWTTRKTTCQHIADCMNINHI